MDRGYGKCHVWVENNRVGITQHASDELHGIVYVTVDPGTYREGDVFGTIESTKAAEDLITPCDLTIGGINPEVESNPSVLDDNAEETPVAFVENVDMDGLMTREEYLECL